MKRQETAARQKIAVIIGAGPAGLTAAYELLTTTDVKPIILEASPTYVGGISKTVNYKGNRIDIGGHRFFSKSDTVMDWWQRVLPVEGSTEANITYRGAARSVAGNQGTHENDNVILVRQRLSRVYYNRKFFVYPIKLSVDTVRKLGFWKMIKIGITYIYRTVRPRSPEQSLEDFFINRFGDELYRTFFKSYTEKVWGKSCNELSADWGAQRVKGLSITKALIDALKKPFRTKDIRQKGTETSLIEQFLYPKYGPGHLWETVAKRVRELGGEIHMDTRATALTLVGDRVVSVQAKSGNGEATTLTPDYVFSTTSIKELSSALGNAVPPEVSKVASALEFRDFITVGVLIKKTDVLASAGSLDDTWIYIHEPNVLVGRVQIFNNWSPYMVADENMLWIGLEYFCTEGDALWNKTDAELKALAARELETLGFIKREAVADAMVLRERKTYPVYAGAYEQFPIVQSYLNRIENLFPVGRNGMHRYNNQDHSMLTAMAAVAMIKEGKTDKTALWEINTEQDYHEEKAEKKPTGFFRWVGSLSQEKLIVICSLLVSFGLLATLVLANTHHPRFPVLDDSDSMEYFALGQNIFNLGAYTLSTSSPLTAESFRAPGYPIFLALLFPFHEYPYLISIVQLGLYAATIVFMYRLVSRVISARAAILVALLMVVNVSAIYNAVIVLSDTLFTFFLVLALYWFFSPSDSSRFTRFMTYSGVALGVAILTRPIAQFLPLVLLPVYYAFHLRAGGVKSMKPFFVFVMAAVLTVMPWLIRNYVHYDTVAITSVAGYNMLYHNAAEYYAYREGVPIDEARIRLLPDYVHDTPILETRSLAYASELREVAGSYLAENATGYAVFHMVKTAPFFLSNSFADAVAVLSPVPASFEKLNLSSLLSRGEFGVIFEAVRNDVSASLITMMFFLMNLVGWLFFYVLMLFGLYVAWRRDKKLQTQTGVFLVTAFMLILYFAVLTGPVANARYRLPAEPFIFTLAVFGATILFAYLKRQRAS